TLDAFDFFVLIFVLAPVAHDFHVSLPKIVLTLTASLAMRPVGAVLFGLMADRYGRRLPLMLDITFYSVIEVLSGLAPNYKVFLVLRLLYGIGMGGEWGVGASLAMESVPPKWRGILSGFLQEGYALGYLLAAAVYSVVFPHWGWRAMFLLGGLPALLSLFVFAKVKETEAWHESRTDWGTYGRAIARHWKLFLYMVGLMTAMNCISHGTQDLFPTFLQRERHFSPEITAMVITPAWLLAPSVALMLAAAFLMQFMVQGGWGVIPVHLNELSPYELRGFFPGLAYQLGVLFASSIT